MILKNFGALWSCVERTKRIKVAIPGACDEHTLEATNEAYNKGLIYPVLIGNKNAIEEKIKIEQLFDNQYEIIEAEDGLKSGQAAVDCVNQGRADMIMKGNMHTADLLRCVVSSDNNFKKSNKLSHFGLVELPGYHKLIALTDSALIVSPTLEDKKAILFNAIETYRNIGYECPKAAIICAVETINENMIETVHAAELKKMAYNCEFGNCVVEGPISYDLSMSREAAEVKGYPSNWCGDFDILLMPNMVTGNVLSKSWSLQVKAKLSGMIVGAKCPIAIGSRSATVEDKVLSILLCAVSLGFEK